MTQQHANPEDFDLYALGALDGEEKQALEAHLSGCGQCRQELAQARARASLLGLTAAPVAPPPAAKSALMERIHGKASMPKVQTMPAQPRKKRWGLTFSLSFAAAAVILAFACYWLGKDDRQQRQENRQLHAQLQAAQNEASQEAANLRAYADIIAAPDTVSVTLQQQAGGTPGQAHVLYNARMGLVVYSGQISPPPAGKSYQLWLVPSSGAPVNAGLIAANQQSGAAVAHTELGLGAKAFAVTLEPGGGSPQPTGPKVLAGTVGS
ncbi:MAG: anti-sigma factor [Terracidiphilus sp.]